MKAGDKVRCIEHGGVHTRKGSIYTIRDVDIKSDICWVEEIPGIRIRMSKFELLHNKYLPYLRILRDIIPGNGPKDREIWLEVSKLIREIEGESGTEGLSAGEEGL